MFSAQSHTAWIFNLSQDFHKLILFTWKRANWEAHKQKRSMEQAQQSCQFNPSEVSFIFPFPHTHMYGWRFPFIFKQKPQKNTDGWVLWLCIREECFTYWYRVQSQPVWVKSKGLLRSTANVNKVRMLSSALVFSHIYLSLTPARILCCSDSHRTASTFWQETRTNSAYEPLFCYFLMTCSDIQAFFFSLLLDSSWTTDPTANRGLTEVFSRTWSGLQALDLIFCSTGAIQLPEMNNDLS